MKQRKGLGRGLGALLPEKEVEEKKEDGEKAVLSTDIALSAIETNPYQPRTHFDKESLQELADSIRTQGIIQPITVRELSAGKYQLISGERRLQASKLANLKNIPAYIRAADNQQMLEMALIENIQRENLNAIEIAQSYQRLMVDCNLNLEDLGDRVGKKRSTVNNYLRLLKLPKEVQEGLREKAISMGHARAILGLDDEGVMSKVFKKTVSDQLSVRKVEEWVRTLNQKEVEQKAPKKVSALRNEHLNLQENLASWFGTKVLIKSDAKSKGEIKIPFTSTEQLEEILNRLKK
ncbi:ParB/RepB/Spo0J family partition protein [Arcticibacterium luteifluviistationis]|uniref:Chromosome partitioning protein ParB n=1 Tax=Arcticibacterium luteifluviistationis TaxID=1784714 RepID=A0A2Z4G839_9BACT|nr:ParB/RepB/Spo0J family partition protein [Arcticibacterium luteifluviistationis]AWV97316.1 chromosome partitioning protein ParB [Arcticibacterium luteifluviistationis]